MLLVRSAITPLVRMQSNRYEQNRRRCMDNPFQYKSKAMYGGGGDNSLETYAEK